MQRVPGEQDWEDQQGSPAPDQDDQTSGKLISEASEADLLEQHRTLSPADEPDERPTRRIDVPEADAWDQARSVPLDDDHDA